MSEISDLWREIKGKLNDQQKGRLPKYDYGKKFDTFLTSHEKAVRALKDAKEAFWNAYAEGSKPKAESARDLVAGKLFAFVADPKNKDIDQLIGKDLNRLDRLIVGHMNDLVNKNDEI